MQSLRINYLYDLYILKHWWKILLSKGFCWALHVVVQKCLLFKCNFFNTLILSGVSYALKVFFFFTQHAFELLKETSLSLHNPLDLHLHVQQNYEIFIFRLFLTWVIHKISPMMVCRDVPAWAATFSMTDSYYLCIGKIRRRGFLL